MAQKKIIEDDVLIKMHRDGTPQKDIAAHFGVSPVAVCKRLKRILPPPETVLDKFDLTDKEKSFVIEKAKGKSSTQAVLSSAYEAGSMESAKQIGTQLMKKEEIRQAIDEVMDNCGLTRTYRVRKLKKHVDNRDPVVSLKALDMSFKLDGSYAPEKHAVAELSLFALAAQLEDKRYREFMHIGQNRGEEAIDVTPKPESVEEI